MVLVGFGIAFNLATYIMLRKYKRQIGSRVSCVHQRTLSLSQIYAVCFAVFKISCIFTLAIGTITDWEITAKALLYVIINIISNLDAVFHAVTFFFINREARFYLTKRVVGLNP